MKYLLSSLIISATVLMAGCTAIQPVDDVNTNLNQVNNVGVTNTGAESHVNESDMSTETTNTNETPSAVETNTADKTDVTDDIDETVENTNEEIATDVDTSDWLTYSNEEYGFSFRYPVDYSVEIVSPGYELRINNSLGETIKFYKQYYSEAGVDDTLLFSKTSLSNLKDVTEFKGSSNHEGVIINSYYAYSIPGGNFYKSADFFLGPDYVSMNLSLNTGSQVNPNQTEEIDTFIKKLEEGESLSSNEKQLTKVFDVIKDTISVD